MKELQKLLGDVKVLTEELYKMAEPQLKRSVHHKAVESAVIGMSERIDAELAYVSRPPEPWLSLREIKKIIWDHKPAIYKNLATGKFEDDGQQTLDDLEDRFRRAAQAKLEQAQTANQEERKET